MMTNTSIFLSLGHAEAIQQPTEQDARVPYNQMILLVVTGVVFLGLLAAAVLKIKQKVIALGACVILLVLCNFANEIAAANQHPLREAVPREALQAATELTPALITVLTNETAEDHLGELLQEEREMVGWIVRRWQAHEGVLVYFQNLHRSRLRMVLELANHRINRTDANRNIHAFHIDFKNQTCDSRCYRKTFSRLQKEAYGIIVVENVKNSQQLSALENAYEQGGVSIIFQNLPRFFRVHTISRLTFRYPFSNNYLPKILQHHPSKTIEYCSLYRSFDYAFYSASLTLPLMELCSRAPPLTAATKCVRKYITEEKMRVPESWVKQCLLEQGQQGLVVENGWVGLKKEHFWSGKGNRTEIPAQEDL